MPSELTPDLAVIFIQYAKNALPRPYTDFERFEIFTTLLEELDPFEPYEAHRARIHKDARSDVIPSELLRVQLYEQWAPSACRARRAGNKDWNGFISFVNAQLKFHVDLNYEQFRFLCDEMAGFRLNPLADNKKRSLFWGCVLRREWRFARIQDIIDSRERMEEFVGPVLTSEQVTDYAARIALGLQLPSVPTSAEALYPADDGVEPGDAAKDGSGPLVPEQPRSCTAAPRGSLLYAACSPTAILASDKVGNNEMQGTQVETDSLLALQSPDLYFELSPSHAADVAEVITEMNRLEDSFTAGELNESELGDCMLLLGTTIESPSEDMKAFGRHLQKRLETLEAEIPENSVSLYNALWSFAHAAQGIFSHTTRSIHGPPEPRQAVVRHSPPANVQQAKSPDVSAGSGTPRKEVAKLGVSGDSEEPLSAGPPAEGGSGVSAPNFPHTCTAASRMQLVLPLKRSLRADLANRAGSSPAQLSKSSSPLTPACNEATVPYAQLLDSRRRSSGKLTRSTSAECLRVSARLEQEEALAHSGTIAALEPGKCLTRSASSEQLSRSPRGRAGSAPGASSATMQPLRTSPSQLATQGKTADTHRSSGRSPELDSPDDGSTIIPIYFGHACYGPRGLVYVDGPCCESCNEPNDTCAFEDAITPTEPLSGLSH